MFHGHRASSRRTVSTWLVFLTLTGAFAAAEPPGTADRSADTPPVPELPLLEKHSAQGEQEQIAEVIQGDLRGEPKPLPSWPPNVRDVVEIIRQRGSVLDGSVLDPNAGAPEDSPGSPMAEGKSPSAGDPAAFATRTAPRSIASRRALIAESLLRASRQLESLGETDPHRRELIEKMRAEAGRLLSQ